MSSKVARRFGLDRVNCSADGYLVLSKILSRMTEQHNKSRISFLMSKSYSVFGHD